MERTCRPRPCKNDLPSTVCVQVPTLLWCLAQWAMSGHACMHLGPHCVNRPGSCMNDLNCQHASPRSLPHHQGRSCSCLLCAAQSSTPCPSSLHVFVSWPARISRHVSRCASGFIGLRCLQLFMKAACGCHIGSTRTSVFPCQPCVSHLASQLAPDTLQMPMTL